MASNFLGPFSFVSLTNPVGRNGAPLMVRAENEIIQRKGVHGTGVRRFGQKGMQFQMVSVRDTATMNGAGVLYQQYQLLTTEVAQRIVFKGVDYDSFGIRYVILDVSDPDITPLRNKVGGILGASAIAAKLMVIWTLIPVTLVQEGGQLTQG